MTTLRLFSAAILAAALLTPATTEARSKLVTLPNRDAMVVSLENPSQTLVYEERVIPLQQGTNQIDFSWQGVSIDAGSVMLEFLLDENGSELPRMIATGFPPNENALTWQVYAPDARSQSVRVSYLLSGLAFESSYDLRMTADEKTGDFRHFITLTNNSGEKLEEAVLRFRGVEELNRSMDSGETRRFMMGRKEDLSVRKVYRVTPDFHYFRGEEGETISLAYEMAPGDLPLIRPLPVGKARIFAADGTGSNIFIGEDTLSHSRQDRDPALNLGTVKDVLVKRRLMAMEQQNVINNNSNSAVKFDVIRRIRYEVENFKKEAAQIVVEEPIPVSDWSVREATTDGVTTKREAIDRLSITIDLPPATDAGPGKTEVNIELLLKDVFPGEGIM